MPGTDGGAHPAALEALGVRAADSVPWDDLVAVMVDVSDNAVPDLLRATLGDEALVEAAAAAGWTAPDLPSYAGEALLAPGPVPDGTDRRVAALATARAYADDPTRRAAAAAEKAQARAAQAAAAQSDPAVAEALLADLEAQRRWFDGGPAGSVAQLAGLHRAAATDGLGPGVSAVVRRHLERGLADRLPTGVLGAGQKGGSLPGLISNAFTVRRADGTTGVSVTSLAGMAVQPWVEALASGALLQVTQQVLLDGDVRDRLAAAVGRR